MEENPKHEDVCVSDLCKADLLYIQQKHSIETTILLTKFFKKT